MPTTSDHRDDAQMDARSGSDGRDGDVGREDAADGRRADGDDGGDAGGPDRTLGVPFGSQALVLMSSLESPLELLPRDAFENLLVVSTTRPPQGVEQLVRDAGGDPNTVGVVPVSGSPVRYDGPCWTTDAVNPNDLSGIHARYERGLGHVKPGEGWVVVDNVNVLLMYAERTSVLQFLDGVAAGARRRNAAGAYALVREAVTNETYERIASTFDVEHDRRRHE
jgi:hypothetical protein